MAKITQTAFVYIIRPDIEKWNRKLQVEFNMHSSISGRTILTNAGGVVFALLNRFEVKLNSVRLSVFS